MLTTVEKNVPTSVALFEIKFVLGTCLATQMKSAEAEPLLHAACEDLQQREDRASEPCSATCDDASRN